LKEAYAKARGLGLTLPLASFAFDPRAPEIRVRCAPDVDDAPGEWRFERLRPTPCHALAIAARGAPGGALSVRLCEAEADFP
jgi:4'-phosphopantetheinyl transferase